MTDILYIRGLSPEVKAELEKRAKEKGISLSKYAANILTDFVINPLVIAQEDKYSNLLKDITGLYQSLNTSTKEVISECTLVLREVKERLGEE